MSVSEIDVRTAPELGSRGRLVLSVSLPRLARHSEQVLDWLARYDRNRHAQCAAALASIPGFEGLSLLAQFPLDERLRLIETFDLPSEDRARLNHIAERLGEPDDETAPATGLLQTVATPDASGDLPGEQPPTVSDDQALRDTTDELTRLAALVETWPDEERGLRALKSLTAAALRTGLPLDQGFWQKAVERVPLVPETNRLHLLFDLAKVLELRGMPRQAYQLWQSLLPLLDQLGNMQGKAAILHQMAIVLEQQGEIARALQLCQQSLDITEQIGDVRGKAAALHQMAVVLEQQGEIAQALELWRQSLDIKEQIGDVRGQSATLHNMAVVLAQQGETACALELYQQSLEIAEQIGAVRTKAATLHQMAFVLAQQEEIARALELYQQSLEITEQTGDVRTKAVTLNQMALVLAQQGETARALELYQRSLDIKEQIEDARGKAVTLANMAWAAGQQGDATRGRELYLRGAEVLANCRAWPDLVTVLTELGTSKAHDASHFLAQALWLALRVQVPLEPTMNAAAGLFRKLDASAILSPAVAAAAVYLVRTQGAEHPLRHELEQTAVSMMQACARARNIPDDELQQWMTAEGLDDLQRWRPELERGLQELVGDAWLFDRRLLEA